ncbi:alpha/beta hydrolase [Actinoplanes sp. NPDC026619]|uniref:alpha/beta fold hydrolase n=1 Tax=Actinoplanes sp. NPDC026619 TaxID=3155798 RepID=UPI003411503F
MVRGVGLLPALVWGVLAGFWRPRGPIFPIDAVAILLISVAVGVFAGRFTRARWSIFLAPVLFAVAGEITRVGFTGPTVDYPRPTSLGLLALIVGRGLYMLLALLPMAVGAAYGAGWARRRSVRSRSVGAAIGRGIGRFVAVVLAAVVLVTGAVVAVPGRVTAIPGGISELAWAGKLGLMIRGARADAPVLLFVPGAPGGSELAAMRQRLAALEQTFVVVTMDRRGGGRSFGDLDPTPTFTVDDERRNVLEVTDYLRSRFRRDKIYLVAHSGGTIGATLAVQDSPELFAAYVGVGQVANPTASDRTQYDDMLARARSAGDTALVKRLTEVGKPPYANIYGYEPMILNEDAVYGSDNGDTLLANAKAPELGVLDKIHVIAGFLDSFDAYYPRVRDVDFRTQVPTLAVPVYFVAGDREVPARVRDLNLWFAVLQAPHKEIVTLANAGHRSMFDQPAEFVTVLKRVLADNPASRTP